MKRLTLIPLIILLSAYAASAQYYTNQNKVWTFGTQAGVDFASGSPVAISSNINTYEGCASVCDPATGSLLFYTDGRVVWNRLGGIMPSGSSIATFGTSSSSQGALIIPVIGSATQFYIFSMEEVDFASGYCNLVYCKVDMSLAAGMGDVVASTRGTPLANNLGEKQTAIPGNSCNIWLVTHRRDSTKFLAFEITGTGINTTPVVSTVGTLVGASDYGTYGIGLLKASPDRSKIVTTSYNPGYTTSVGTELYDFNPATGVVSNCRPLETTMSAYGAEFSPDNTKLYVDDNPSFGSPCRISQYDITGSSAAAILATRYTVVTGSGYPQLKLGPNNKIYMIGISGTNYLDAINNPNVSGAGCNYVAHAVDLSPGSGVFGLPNIIVSVLPDTIYSHHDTTACVSPSGLTLHAHDTGSTYLWSTGDTTITTVVTTPGLHWVAVRNGCDYKIDTIKVIRLLSDPPPVISGKQIYCYGDPFVPFTVAGVNITWYATSSSTAGTTTAPVINTSAPGTYTVFASQRISCESPLDSFTVVVNPRISPNFTYTLHAGCDRDTVYFTNIPTFADAYAWDFGDGSPGDTGRVSTMHIYTHGIYSVKLTGRTPVCDRDTTIPINTTHPIHADFAPTPDTFCAITNSSTMINASVPASALVNYSWRYGDGTTDVSATPGPHTYNSGGVYPVTLVITDTLGCQDSVTKNVYALQLNITNKFHDTTLCIADPLLLANKVTIAPNIPFTNYVYQWTPTTALNNGAIREPHYSGLGFITFTDTVTILPWGCQAWDTVHIHSVQVAPLTNLTPTSTIPYGSTIQLNAGNEVFYMWKPDDGSLDNNNINNPVAKPQNTTIYTVYGYDINGCMDSATITVYVDSAMNECIPTAFTPNGDGLNDIFRPYCMKFQKLVDFRVFNRWGETVFQTSDISKGWDGTYKGQPQDLGVYYYNIIVARPGGENIIFKGDVTLIR